MPVDTKMMIASTLAQMAQKRPIDKITVKDLVEQCGISRQTFYYHFQDMLDVMEWSVRQMVQHVLQDGMQAETPQKVIQAFIHIAVENSDSILRLQASRHRVQVESIFVDATRSSIQQMIYKKKPQMFANYPDLEVTLNFYAYGIAGIIFECCKHTNDIDEERLAEQLYQLLSCGTP